MTNEHELIKELRSNMDLVIEAVKEDMATVRVGRAKPDLVSSVMVQAYGTRMRLQEVATIMAPDTNMLTITPFDKSLLRDIEKGISDSGLGLSGVVSGDMVRIVIPALTQERRLDFVKLLKQKAESGRVMVRQARQESKEKIDALKKQDGVSEDEIFALHDQLDKVTAEYNEKVAVMEKAREEEIMAV